MHKVIHSDFEIDLSRYKLTITEENHWFSDTFFTKRIFPFTIPFSEDVAVAFEVLRHHNAENPQLNFDCEYVNGDILEKATLEINEVNIGLSLTIYYGIDTFPNFDKKLSELELLTVTVDDIAEHAKTIITQGFPSVNYNFPQIHVDHIDTSDDGWFHFKKTVNNYDGVNFIINEVIDDEIYNRNYIQPMPYLLYVLKRGFELGGYTLSGDIVNSSLIKKMVLYKETDYYVKNDLTSIDLSIIGDEYSSLSSDSMATYTKSVTIDRKGKYTVSGSINLLSRWKKTVYLKIKYRNILIASYAVYDAKNHSGFLHTKSFEKTFSTVNDGQPDEIVIESYQFHDDSNYVLNGYADSVVYFDDNGSAVANLSFINKIDINKVVPDITFGEFVSILKNWFNLDINLSGNEISMNYIESQLTYNNAFDLSNKEVKYPNLKLNTQDSFILKYSDVDSTEYSFSEVFYSKDGWVTDSITPTDNTKTIEIKALPLPLLYRNEIQTAHAFESNNSKLNVVLYGGLINDKNICENSSYLFLPNLAPIFWEKWFQFRVTSILYKWNFKSWIEDIMGLKAQGKVFAYGNYHVVKTINKTEIKEDLFDIEIETYKLL